MSSGIGSANPRIRGILVRNCGIGDCCICGKSTTKRNGRQPAPIRMILEFSEAVFRNNFAWDNAEILPGPAQIGVPMCLARKGWELGHALRVSGAVCLACAKRLSSRLDAVIDQIESEYR
jgi:hypothetical protein